MKPKIILKTFEEMKKAFRAAHDGDVLFVDIDFHKQLLLWAAERGRKKITVVVIRNVERE